MRAINPYYVFGDGSSENSHKYIPRFTYREQFLPIDSGLTSDKGWGCCYRACQSILACYSILLNKIHHDLFASSFGSLDDPLALFYDQPSAIFGIHNLVIETSKLGVKKGEWAKPSNIAIASKNLLESVGLSCLLAQDFVLKKSSVSSAKFPCIVLIPGLFGLGEFEMRYLPFLQMCLCLKGSLGFVSGRRNSAYYIAAFDYENFFFFDPHTNRKAVTQKSQISSFFDSPIKSMGNKRINPSILLGFYVDDSDELRNLLSILLECSPSPFFLDELSDEAVDKMIEMNESDCAEGIIA